MARSASRGRGYVASLTKVLNKLRLSGPARVGVASTVKITSATQGSALTITAGALPAGLALDSATRSITGTPTLAGSANFTITETLVGATGNPKATALTIEVLADRQTYLLEPSEKITVLPANGATIRVTSADGAVSRTITGLTTFGPYLAAQKLYVDGAATVTKVDTGPAAFPIALRTAGIAGPADQVRVLSSGGTDTYVVCNNPAIGPMAHHLKVGQGIAADASNLGVNYGNLRLYGTRVLSDVLELAPLTNYKTIISNDIGSQQFAMRFGGKYGGKFHGFGTTGSTTRKVFTGLLDAAALAGEMFLPSFVSYSEDLIDWSGGTTQLVKNRLSFFPDGSWESDTSIPGGIELQPVYLGPMVIGAHSFSEAKLPGDASYTRLVMPAAQGTSIDYPFNGDTVMLREPSTGIVMTVTDDSRTSARFHSKYVRRDDQRCKLYARLDSEAGQPFPATRVRCRVEYSKTDPDLFQWSGSADGIYGIYQWSGSDPVIIGGALRFTRDPAVIQKRQWWVGGLVIGATYRIPVVTALAGGGATNASNGMTYLVTTSETGSSSGAAVSKTFQTLIDAGNYLEFVATKERMQLVIQQTASATAHVVDVFSLGPIVRL